MKILLAPSETKKTGGTFPFDPNTLLFETLRAERIKLLHAYTNVLQKGDMEVSVQNVRSKKRGRYPFT